MRLGDYEVLRPIARGGMGVVFEVEHRGTGARYAAKVVKEAGDARARERFKREAELLARVDRHPGIVKIHSFGEAQDGNLYMILDLVQGESLDKMLARAGTVEPRAAAALARAVALALGAAHTQGIVHRDVKPANILVEAASGEPRLADFGIAAARDLDRLTRTGAFVGTVAYVAPEQARGAAGSPASDVWSLGAVLFELLAGRAPIAGSTPLEIFDALLTDAPIGDVRKLRPEVPAPLAAIVARALEKDPARRPADGATLAAELDAFLAGRAPRATRGARGRRAAALGVAILLLAGAASVLLPRERPREGVEPGGDADDGTRERIAALEAIARGNEGKNDLVALLAARSARALAGGQGATVSWKTDAAGARAADALGATRAAIELASAALADAPADTRKDELHVLRARALLQEGDRASSLAELYGLTSIAAQRLRAHVLVLEGRWEELDGLSSSDPQVGGARVLARCHLDGETKKARRALDALGGDQGAVACALEIMDAGAEIAALGSAIGEGQTKLNFLLLNDSRAILDPCLRAVAHLEDARRVPRWVSGAEVAGIVDRALSLIERSKRFNAFVKYPHDLIARLVGAALFFARAHDPVTFSLQVHAECVEIKEKREGDAARVAFLEAHLDDAPASVKPRIVLLVAHRDELAFEANRVHAPAIVPRLERLLARLPDVAATVAESEACEEAEWLAGELALRSWDASSRDSDAFLARARSHLERAVRFMGDRPPETQTNTTEQQLFQEPTDLSVEMALARGDLASAERDVPAPGTLDGDFLGGEIRRLRGDAAHARPMLDRAAAAGNSLVFGADAVLAAGLARVALGERGSVEWLEQVYRLLEGRRLLPWIDRDVHKALGK
jgi:serine/threonine-protein kinase